MSSVNKQEQKQEQKNYVVTYKELIFTIFIFVVILIALYPKDLLKRQIVSEKANYDLSMLYLKNLLKHDPEDESLMLILATQSLKTGKRDLAIRLLELLFKSKDPKVREKATMLSYDLEKERYFYIKDKVQQEKQMHTLKKLFLMIYYAKMYKLDNVKKWYEEAVFVGAREPAYTLLKEALKLEPNKVSLLKDGFFLSVNFSRKEDSYRYINLLKEYDTKNYDYWVLQEYYMDMRYKEYAKAEQLLLANKGRDPRFMIILGDFYFFKKRFQESSDIYLSLYKNATHFKEKKEYFKKALQALVAANNMPAVNRLVKENESKFLQDSEMRKFMLKIYLGNGKLDSAARLSHKILRLKYKQ